MKRVYRCVAVLVSLLLLCSCAEPSRVVGRWITEDPSGYYFELYEDGTCVMFDAQDAWVSEGTYRVRGHRVLFDMDTGEFTWRASEGGMAFDNGSTTIHYYLGE